MSRGARFGRGSFFRGSSGGPLLDRERAAGGVHLSSTRPSPFESKEESRCKNWRIYLEKSIADSEAVGDDCLSCDQYFELMSGCPGVENRVDANVLREIGEFMSSPTLIECLRDAPGPIKE